MSQTGAVSDPAALRAAAYDILRREPGHRDAHLRLYELEQMLGTPAAAVAHLRAALRHSALIAGPPRSGLRVLALSRIAPWEANVPLELVVDESAIVLSRLYLDGTERSDDLVAAAPRFDVLFNSIAESDDAISALTLAEQVVCALNAPCVNPPGEVLQLSRDRVAKRFLDSALVDAPVARRMGRAALDGLDVQSPLIVRPVGSQAGIGLARIDTTTALRHYLARTGAGDYYVSPFVDYRAADGFYRKYRIMFVRGVPLACHLAISPNWMVHYYNAPMSENAWMRDEEAAFIADLDAVFTGPLADALREIAARIRLEYFGIDCAIVGERLLLFEADASMLVHGTDPADVYPYKRAAFTAIQSALTELCAVHHGSVSGR